MYGFVRFSRVRVMTSEKPLIPFNCIAPKNNHPKMLGFVRFSLQKVRFSKVFMYACYDL